MRKRRCLLLVMCMLVGVCIDAQEMKNIFSPKIHGTIRGKYEYQPDDDAGRFEVRNARVSLEDTVMKYVGYKAEIDLSDEGKIKMLDAYGELNPDDKWSFRIGQMRVPFTIDAHRSPAARYFANRSFIAKQVADIRDVGGCLEYRLDAGFPIILQGGLFNGSGLTNQKDYWTKSVNFSAKAQFLFPKGFNLTMSVQKVKPEDVVIMMYDVGTYWQNEKWHIECEYLRKYYENHAFKSVTALNTFINYDIPLKTKFFKKISPLARYDYMTDQSDGLKYMDKVANKAGKLIVNDYKRQRVTGGVTLSLSTPFVADIRINYEKYFYGHAAIIQQSEKDKIVFELMTRF
jgi:hypothetical protein